MALTIVWTDEAEHHLDNILAYISNKWTQREVSNFLSALEEGLKIISTKPLKQKKSMRKPNAYEYQLSPQTTIFYEFDEHVVTIMLLWSNRMDLKK